MPSEPFPCLPPCLTFPRSPSTRAACSPASSLPAAARELCRRAALPARAGGGGDAGLVGELAVAQRGTSLEPAVSPGARDGVRICVPRVRVQKISFFKGFFFFFFLLPPPAPPSFFFFLSLLKKSVFRSSEKIRKLPAGSSDENTGRLFFLSRAKASKAWEAVHGEHRVDAFLRERGAYRYRMYSVPWLIYCSEVFPRIIYNSIQI